MLTSPARRTSIFVTDMDASLSFYRDVLKMQVFYDQVIEAEASSRLLGVPGARSRVVSLQSDEAVSGMVGLVSFLEPPLRPRQEVMKALSGPDFALLFMAEDIDITGTYEAVKDHGAEIISAPLEYEVPERGTICGFTCKDPDGVLVAVMRFGGLDRAGAVKLSPIRRNSIVVTDLAASLEFYQRVLGMNVFYDHVIESEAEGKLLGVPGARVRMVSLQAGDAVEGMVGLLEVQDPPLKTREKVRELVSCPDIALIFLTEDIQGVHEKVSGSGFRVQSPPLEYEIPQRGICSGFSCYDPNGILVEFTQFGPLGR
jgi:catechol 2,3-dioxygenase-like lactoylglutathione lyase family enzyme